VGRTLIDLAEDRRQPRLVGQIDPWALVFLSSVRSQVSDYQAAHANDRKPARPSEWPDALDRPELAPTQLDHGVAKVRLVSKTAIGT
jgi:hypothetical protein